MSTKARKLTKTQVLANRKRNAQKVIDVVSAALAKGKYTRQQLSQLLSIPINSICSACFNLLKKRQIFVVGLMENPETFLMNELLSA